MLILLETRKLFGVPQSRSGSERYYWNASNLDVLWDPPPGVRPEPWHHGVLIPNKNPSNSPQGDLGSREVAQLQSLGFLDSKSRDVLGKFWAF